MYFQVSFHQVMVENPGHNTLEGAAVGLETWTSFQCQIEKAVNVSLLPAPYHRSSFSCLSPRTLVSCLCKVSLLQYLFKKILRHKISLSPKEHVPQRSVVVYDKAAWNQELTPSPGSGEERKSNLKA